MQEDFRVGVFQDLQRVFGQHAGCSLMLLHFHILGTYPRKLQELSDLWLANGFEHRRGQIYSDMVRSKYLLILLMVVRSFLMELPCSGAKCPKHQLLESVA